MGPADPGFPPYDIAGVSRAGAIYVETETTDGRTGSLYGQIYSPSGAPAGPSVLLAYNSQTQGSPPIPFNVTALSGGGWASAWQRNENNAGGPTFQVEVGVLDAHNVLLKTLEFTTSYGFGTASVAGLGDGGFVVEWGTAGKYSAGNTYVQTFDAAGVATSAQAVLSDQSGPVFAAAVGGGGAYVVTVPTPAPGVDTVQYFDGAAFRPPVTLPAGAYPTTGVALANGDVALVWDVTANSSSTLYSQVFDPASNSLIGSPIALDVNGAVQYAPHAIATPDGGYVVSWNSQLYGGGYTAARAVGPSGSVGPVTSIAGDLTGAFGTSSALAVSRDDTGRLAGQDYTITSGAADGQVLRANDTPGQMLAGGAGGDVLYAGHNSAVLSGNGGADSFVFEYLPWNAGRITDFTVGADHLDLSALLRASGYTGADPIADGYVSLAPDGAGGTNVFYDTDGRASGNSIQFKITDLEHVQGNGLSWAQLSGSAGGTSRLRLRLRLHHHLRRRPRASS